MCPAHRAWHQVCAQQILLDGNSGYREQGRETEGWCEPRNRKAETHGEQWRWGGEAQGEGAERWGTKGRTPVSRAKHGAGPAGTRCLGFGEPTRAREGPGSGWTGGGSGLQGHRTVLIQRHRSDGMRAINYCDKMQSWPAHCRRGRSIPVPSPTPGPMPRLRPAGTLLPISLSIPPTTHMLPLTARVAALGKRQEQRGTHGGKVSPYLPSPPPTAHILWLPSVSHPHYDLGGSSCHDTHFTDAETEAPIGKVTWPKSHRGEW